jgi:hypothetical protein
MSEQKPKFIIIARKPVSKPSLGAVSSQLKSRGVYTCKNHPHNEAYCLCAKCGALLCSSCSLQIGGRRYCETCLFQDENLYEKFESELISIPQETTKSFAAPQKVSQLPKAIANMVSDSVTFFKTAKNSSFALTFCAAAIALIPNAIVLVTVRRDALLPQTEQFKPFADFIGQLNTPTLIGAAIVTIPIQILLLDFVFDTCLRIIAKSQMSFRESASTLHFCILPLVFSVFGTWFDLQFITFCALCFMIILATTAIRVTTNCNLLRGVLANIAFIFFSTLLGIL